MNILLVYPKYPDTFWSWKHILPIVDRKAAFPPLGLLTVAAMLPVSWNKKLVDMNVSNLTDDALRWADCVFVSAMVAQKKSVKEVVSRCNNLGVRVVAGGPLFTMGYEEFTGIDHFVLGEAENLIPRLSQDLAAGRADRIYASDVRPTLDQTPIPMWELIDVNDYVALSVQHSRGCPFDCEFCDITFMDGRVPRIKPADRFLMELDAIFKTDFRGMVLVVDDNFIGNSREVETMLRALITWQRGHNYPFTFSTEASVNLADKDNLMKLMVEAGFNQVFLGLETPSSVALAECGKKQNQRDLVAAVKKIHRFGLRVAAGFIVGFDSDPETIFDDQINFIQKSGVVVAMVSLLQAIPKTKLHKRLSESGRLLSADSSGDNTDGSLNFVTVMDRGVLVAGYNRILRTIYSPEKYYERVFEFLKDYDPRGHRNRRTDPESIKAFIRSIWYIGIRGSPEDRRYYWRTLHTAFFKYRHLFSEAVALEIYGLHLQRVANSACEL